MSVTARGGYQIADFKNISIPVDNTTVEIPGIFEQISGGDKKPVIAYNLNINNGFVRGISYLYLDVIRPNNIVGIVRNSNGVYLVNVYPNDLVKAVEQN